MCGTWWLLLFCAILSCVHCFLLLPKSSSYRRPSELKYRLPSRRHGFRPSKHDNVPPGEPLFLTPYIRAGLIEEGRNVSRVPSIIGNYSLESYSGFLTVNDKWNSNLFFWFFPNERRDDRAPVLLWLQGGPGVTSLYGLFIENGPYQLLVLDNGNDTLTTREYSWTKDFNVLYIDQPVGSGFSFTQSKAGYAKDQNDVVRDLYPALVQFFELFPRYAENDFYVAGESYAGKYVPSIATTIHRKNALVQNGGRKINLKGLLIGNGWSDPENMMVYGDYLYQLGFVDPKELKRIHEYEHLARTCIRSKQYRAAHQYWSLVFDSLTTFSLDAIYDYTRIIPDPLDDYALANVVNSNAVRKAIHVGSFQFNAINYDAYYAMLEDMMQTSAPLFAELLRHYRLLLYSGQFDVIVAYPLTRSFLQNLHFNGALNYHEARTNAWYDNRELLIGHWKTVNNLTEILVRNAGHMVPMDQPKWAYQMVRHFIDGKFK